MKKAILISCSYLLYLSMYAQTIKGFGDSITEGYGTTHNDSIFLNLVAQEHNLSVLNYATGGSRMFDDCSEPTPECSSSLTKRRFISTSEASRNYVTIFYGTNDPQVIIDSLGTKWQDSLQKYIQESFINEGYSNENIILITLPYNSTWAPEHNTYNRFNFVNQMIRQVAVNLDLKLADLWEATLNAPNGDSMTPDRVHLNNEGHRLLADLVNAQIGVLPLNFTSFTSSCNKITWTTSNEIDVKNFEVQKSMNGQKWETLGIVNKSSLGNYSFNYSNAQNVLLRIVETDTDGRKNYSKIIKSLCSTDVTFNFNSATNVLRLNYPADIKIYNLMGLLVKDKHNATELNIMELPKGIYFLKINDKHYKIPKL